ncbi:MAG: hypothetical protein SGI88_15475 [Candidatus Hydrogenedentes bacterium]|nr:hypothetical protein [Candidatus Hydrogenedentota bacterium]
MIVVVMSQTIFMVMFMRQTAGPGFVGHNTMVIDCHMNRKYRRVGYSK